jgi:RsiW-degrading membrane proteinase PrsW (M82 family)
MLLLMFGYFVMIVSGERRIVKLQVPSFNVTTTAIEKHEHSFLTKAVHFLWNSDGSGYQHVWPVSFHFSVHSFCVYLCFCFIKVKYKSNEENIKIVLSFIFVLR